MKNKIDFILEEMRSRPIPGFVGTIRPAISQADDLYSISFSWRYVAVGPTSSFVVGLDDLELPYEKQRLVGVRCTMLGTVSASSSTYKMSSYMSLSNQYGLDNWYSDAAGKFTVNGGTTGGPGTMNDTPLYTWVWAKEMNGQFQECHYDFSSEGFNVTLLIQMLCELGATAASGMNVGGTTCAIGDIINGQVEMLFKKL